MAAVKTDLVIEQGTTWAQSWKIINFDLDEGGVTWHVESQVRPDVRSSLVLHDFTPVATLSDDIVTISVEPPVSTNWVWGKGVYDVEIHGSDGRVFRIAEGSIVVSPEVTRE